MDLLNFLKERLQKVVKVEEAEPTDPHVQAVKRSPFYSPHRCSVCNGAADKRYEGDTVVSHNGENIRIHWCTDCANEWRFERLAIN